MEDLLINTLKRLGYPVRRQGSLADNEEYPEHFFTFWNNDTEDDSYYDNEAGSTVYDYDVNFYSVDAEKTYSVLSEAVDVLKEIGFIVSGKGHDIASDEPTHTGRGMSITYKLGGTKWKS